MNPEFQEKFTELEVTIRAGNFSIEGLDFLIGECEKASEGETNKLAIAVMAIIRNSTKAKDSCDRLHDWSIENYGRECVNRVINLSIDKFQLEAAFLLNN